ncbi:polyprenyl synthetase family protein [Pseudonocardia spinosispora]|uniref:polyprenyl synthetase family protein n=1 Tax=Pseudonocardia spinosispora TaxID=103441 RepID=UPI0003FC1076|nr:polyprenyl synthetase family protein [Pseudonocardia spinosispora]
MSPGHPPTVLPPETDARLVERVDRVLADYLAGRAVDTAQVHPCITEATDALSEFVLAGGKRVRPTFAWWGWRGAGGLPDDALAEPVLRAISALELVQANALVHDDVMDASDTRRGRPTVHVAFAERHRAQDWLGSSDRFGAGVAILLGDLALAWADDLFHDSGLPERIERRARRVWAGMRTDMLSGQYLDVRGQASGDDSLETALRIDRYKTAAYTIERPLQLGAALGDASAELESAYRRFGADLGVAFQLRDDQLGVFGDPGVTGKPAGDDIREGKRTVLMALAFRTARARSDDAALTVLTSALGDPGLTEDDVARVRGVLDELGASAEVEGRIERLTESALAALASADVAEPAATRLPELALAATRRQS